MQFCDSESNSANSSTKMGVLLNEISHISSNSGTSHDVIEMQ